LKATYNDQIADLKSNNKQLQRELYDKPLEKEEMLTENSLVTDRDAKFMEIVEKSHKEALTQVVT